MTEPAAYRAYVSRQMFDQILGLCKTDDEREQVKRVYAPIQELPLNGDPATQVTFVDMTDGEFFKYRPRWRA